MYRITIDVLDPHAMGPISAKEAVAMVLGPVLDTMLSGVDQLKIEGVGL